MNLFGMAATLFAGATQAAQLLKLLLLLPLLPPLPAMLPRP